MTMPIQPNEVYFAQITQEAIIPTKNAENMGYDLYACLPPEEDYILINPTETKLIPTGIACALHPSKGLIIKERGSIGSLGLTVHCGVVDSGYRGEIFIAMQNCSHKSIIIAARYPEITQKQNENITVIPYIKAIAQAVIVDVPVMETKVVTFDELQTIPSERGSGKLGSSGK